MLRFEKFLFYLKALQKSDASNGKKIFCSTKGSGYIHQKRSLNKQLDSCFCKSLYVYSISRTIIAQNLLNNQFHKNSKKYWISLIYIKRNLKFSLVFWVKKVLPLSQEGKAMAYPGLRSGKSPYKLVSQKSWACIRKISKLVKWSKLKRQCLENIELCDGWKICQLIH